MTTKNTEKSWREFLGEFLGNFNDHTLGMKKRRDADGFRMIISLGLDRAGRHHGNCPGVLRHSFEADANWFQTLQTGF